jgi:hypothetical protein
VRFFLVDWQNSQSDIPLRERLAVVAALHHVQQEIRQRALNESR